MKKVQFKPFHSGEKNYSFSESYTYPTYNTLTETLNSALVRLERSASRSTHPEAKRSVTGFQAQMKTSDSWPRNTVALLAGIWTSQSTSMASKWLSDREEKQLRITNTLQQFSPTVQGKSVHLLELNQCIYFLNVYAFKVTLLCIFNGS